MPKLTTNGAVTSEALMDREPFTTHGALSAISGHVWSTSRLPEPWATMYAVSAGDITYTVLSYLTPIAWVLDDGTVVIPPVKYSITTSGHQSTVRHALDVADMSQATKVSIRERAQRERDSKRSRRRAAADARAAVDANDDYLHALDTIQGQAHAALMAYTDRLRVAPLNAEHIDWVPQLPAPIERDYAPVRLEYSESYSERQGWATSTVRAYASGVHQESLYN